MIKLNNFLYPLSTVFVIVLQLSCNGNAASNHSAANAVKDFPVAVLQPKNTTIFADYPASIQGTQNVEIRPKIDGYVDAIYVDEGAVVKKGQLLFRISAPQYEQDARTAEASIKIAAADVSAAQMQVNKVNPLVQKNIISSYELESAQYNLQSKQAALAQAKATLANAQINIGYTSIRSPVDGVIGILPYKIGSLVSSAMVNPLTTVADIRQIYAYFSINEKQGLDFFVKATGQTMQEKLATLPAVSLVLANGTVMEGDGKVETASGLINAQTGALNMRARFPNASGLVRSGSSALVRIPENIDSAILIPQKSTYQVQGKIFAYQLDQNNKVHSVEIIPGASTDKEYIIRSGVRKGDTIVLDGISSLRENMVIQPVAQTGPQQ